MNFSIHIFYLFILELGFGACQDKLQVSKPEPDTKSPKLLIKTVSYGTDPEAVKWFEYGDNDDIIKQGISADTVEFVYSKNKIIKRHLNKKISWEAKTEYITNEDGRVISSAIYDEIDHEISRFEFLYDEKGYLLRTRQKVLTTGAEYSSEFVYESGNLKEVLMYNFKGEYSSKYAFDYYANQPNIFNLNLQQISDDIFHNERLGKRNKNMISQLANISKEGDTLSHIKYRYDKMEGDSVLRAFQNDVLNDFNTELKYKFIKK
jgi:hypothetical protein